MLCLISLLNIIINFFKFEVIKGIFNNIKKDIPLIIVELIQI